MIQIQSERPQDGQSIEQLLDLAFGANRRTRPSYRLREGLPAIRSLSFTAFEGRQLVGSIRFWPVAIDGGTAGLLLGPIGVHPEFERQGIGTQLVQKGLSAATQRGDLIVVGIGSSRFLGRFGFHRGSEYGLAFPANMDADRFLALELAPGALDGVAGQITRVGEAVA